MQQPHAQPCRLQGWQAGVLLVALLGIPSCSSSTPMQHLQEHLKAAPAGGVCKLRLADGAIRNAAVPVELAQVPRTVRDTFEAVQPGGHTLYLAREWGPDGEAWRQIKRLTLADREQRRWLLVAADGAVIERGQQLLRSDAPARVLELTNQYKSSLKEVRWIGQVLGKPDVAPRYQVLFHDDLGREFILQCNELGQEVQVSRIISAEISGTIR